VTRNRLSETRSKRFAIRSRPSGIRSRPSGIVRTERCHLTKARGRPGRIGGEYTTGSSRRRAAAHSALYRGQSGQPATRRALDA